MDPPLKELIVHLEQIKCLFNAHALSFSDITLGAADTEMSETRPLP